MASLKIFDKTGAEVGTVDLDVKDFAPRISKQLLHDAVVMYQANQRQGTFRTKNRGEVAGSTKKMYRQKGTGNARAGGRRSGVRRGGGHIFAKRPRSFYYRLPRKALQLATRMAVASKLASEQLVIIDDLSFAAPKTKEMAGVLRSLKCEGSTIMVATAGLNMNVYKSARNIEGVEVAPVSDLNALSVMLPRKLLLTRAALDALRASAADNKSGEKKNADKKNAS